MESLVDVRNLEVVLAVTAFIAVTTKIISLPAVGRVIIVSTFLSLLTGGCALRHVRFRKVACDECPELVFAIVA